MALRIDYLARETGQNLVRNPLPTLAAITTAGVALTMLIVSFLASTGISNAFEKWDNDVTFIVYVNYNAPQDQVDALKKSLESSPQVDEVQYFDHQQSYELFQRLFKDQPEMTQEMKPEELPTSFRVKPKNPDAKVVRTVADSFRAKPGVYDVNFVSDAVQAVQKIGDKLQGFLLTGSIVLAVASIFLIFNTVQTAIFARRREIEVMRLVGASNTYIRLPFVFEGLVQGLVGALFAIGSSLLFSYLWLDQFEGTGTKTLFDNITWSTSEYWQIAIAVAVGGTLVSGFVALISTTWYLRD